MPIIARLLTTNFEAAGPLAFFNPKNANGQAMVIEELAGPKVKFVLDGKNMPVKGIPIGDRVITNKVTNPGNSEATIHVMGVEYDDVVLRGRFHDPADLVIGGARRRVELLRGLEHRMNPVRVTWGDNIVRLGIIKSAVLTEHMHDDIDYEITIEVAKAEETGTALDNVVAMTATQQRMEQGLRLAINGAALVLGAYGAATGTINFVETFRRREEPANRVPRPGSFGNPNN